MNNNDWISINEALPTHDCKVLVYDSSDNTVQVFLYDSRTNVFCNFYWNDYEEVSDYEEIIPTYWKHIYLPDGTEAL